MIDLNSVKVKESYKRTILNILDLKATVVDYENSIRHLSRLLYEFYGEQVIVLMDEYDFPPSNGIFEKLL